MRNKSLILIILATMLSQDLLAQITRTETIEHDGLTRSYNIFLPSADEVSDTRLPLLLCFHGFTSSADVIMGYSGFNDLAEDQEFIVVYPQGSLFNGISHWNVGGFTVGSTVDDVGFVSALLDELMDTHQIDQDRIYSTGMSNGGFMSFVLACQMSGRIAAIASITGSMTPGTYDTCDPQRPVPVLQIHGDADSVVPYDGESFSKPISEVLDYWVNHNNCNPNSISSDIIDSNTADGSTVSNLYFENGNQCTAVDHYIVNGGDHTWPGVWGNLDINASEIVWDFVSQYDMTGLIGCLSSNDNLDSVHSLLKVSPNPTTDFILLDGQVDGFQIYNKVGELILSGQAEDRINVSALSSGLYFIESDGQVAKFIKAKH